MLRKLGNKVCDDRRKGDDKATKNWLVNYFFREEWLRAIESVSDQLQHTPENKTKEVEEEKTKSNKVVKIFELS